MKNSARVTPRAVAIFSIEAIEGDTTPFSSWEMKLGGLVRAPMIKFVRPVNVPLKTSRSQLPGTPGTVPVELYCQNCQAEEAQGLVPLGLPVWGFGLPGYCAIHKVLFVTEESSQVVA